AAAGAAAAPKPAAPTRAARDAAFFEEQELRLRSLQRLRERGLLTEEEYQRKRREIIDAL
ncbi:MAG: SHOCT domain-containing protein, partial [Burkholderiales bacterium]|nr:SHOCT domain-containing protein [Burkholderiales bacterium]